VPGRARFRRRARHRIPTSGRSAPGGARNAQSGVFRGKRHASPAAEERSDDRTEYASCDRLGRLASGGYGGMAGPGTCHRRASFNSYQRSLAPDPHPQGLFRPGVPAIRSASLASARCGAQATIAAFRSLPNWAVCHPFAAPAGGVAIGEQRNHAGEAMRSALSGSPGLRSTAQSHPSKARPPGVTSAESEWECD
jgi:hypothetical protein